LESKDKEDKFDSLLINVSKIEDDLNDNDRQVDELERQYEDEKNTLANLASLGILTVCFGHEAKGSANKAYLNAQELKESFEAGKFMIIPDVENDIQSQIRIIMESTHYVHAFASFALENVKRDKRTRRDISISEIARRVIKSLSISLDKQGIAINIRDIDNNIPVIKGFKIDWESIFVNLITNSIWAFRNHTPTGKRKIDISIKETDGFIVIHFSDNGKGLEKGTENLIFRPGFSTRRNEKGMVDGTGMGLAIVEALICDHASGTIEVKSPGELSGAEFIIKIPIQ
jgi:signal transduction histidine kinase